LESAVTEAEKLASEFNRSSSVSRIEVNVVRGIISADDERAVKAINSEMRSLLAEMESGVKNLDATAIREAANKARNVSQMLTPDAQKRIEAAIDAVRSQARKIVKAGETAIADIDRNTFATLAAARTAFLDIDTPQGDIGDVQGAAAAIDLEPVAEVAAPEAEGRGVDFDYVQPVLRQESEQYTDAGIDFEPVVNE
jgi:ElaB/YqjD/DUF883 family membrane-anchored ribosome-binding protein